MSPASIRAARIWRPETMLLIPLLYKNDPRRAAKSFRDPAAGPAAMVRQHVGRSSLPLPTRSEGCRRLRTRLPQRVFQRECLDLHAGIEDTSRGRVRRRVTVT